MEVKVWGWRGTALGAFGRWRFQDCQIIWKSYFVCKTRNGPANARIFPIIYLINIALCILKRGRQ